MSQKASRCKRLFSGTNFEMLCKRISWLALIFALGTLLPALDHPDSRLTIWSSFSFAIWIYWAIEESRFRCDPESVVRIIRILDVGLFSLFFSLLAMCVVLLREPQFQWVIPRVGWVLALGACVSLFYGMYHGMRRWETATRRLLNVVSERGSWELPLNEVISNYFYYGSSESRSLRGTIAIGSSVGIVTVWLSFAGWSDFLVPLTGAFFFTVFPMVLGSSVVRRIKWRKVFGSNDVRTYAVSSLT